MTDRTALKQKFLASTDWGLATVQPMTGDASNRRYDRLHLQERTAILMDAAPERGEDVQPFILIGEHLRAHGFSAPEILARDIENGFLLLEDLGQDRFKEVLEAHPDKESLLYTAATDALIALHQCPLPTHVIPYDTQKMVAVCDPLFSEYRRTISTEHIASDQQSFETALSKALDQHVGQPTVLVERDYHAENLLWLPDRSGVARVGMLDYQDAVSGHPAYDLVSMLQDARRDVSPDIEARMIDRYVQASEINAAAFEAAYWTLGLQRNLRIVGVFARLATKLGKPHYLNLLPRVWSYIERGLERPELQDMRSVIRATVPAPTPDVLRKFPA